MEALLKLEEAAELESITRRSMQKRVENQKIKAVKMPNEKGDARGFEYWVNLDDLSEKAKRKYYKRQKDQLKAALAAEEGETEDEQRERVSWEELTEKQREQVAFWREVIRQWRLYLGDEHGKKTERTREFVRLHNIQHPDRQIKERTLYDKWEKLQRDGETALADGRAKGNRKGKTTIPPEAWSIFMQLWADENQPSIQWCYTQTCAVVKRQLPSLIPLPAVDAFKRQVRQIPVGVTKYYREGSKALDDDVLSYVQRDYEGIDANEWWVSDYHTLDLMVKDDRTGEIYRPHVVLWMDIRSRRVLSWRMRKESDSDGVILSFRDAVAACGIPENVYLDNGKEYLTHAFGGRGRRKTAANAQYATSILDLLGVQMHNALPRNGRAKVIERSFGEFSRWFAKSFITYCGNRPAARPERHNEVMKRENNIPLASEVEELLGKFIAGLHNAQASGAVGLNGKTPNQVYEDTLFKKRTATQDQLNLMLLRSERLQKVSENGVKLKIGGRELWYCNEELKINYSGWQVYVKYDPDDLSSVRVYDDKEALLCAVERLPEGGYDLDKNTEAVKTVNRIRRQHKQSVIAYMDEQRTIAQAPAAHEAMVMVAEDNLAADTSGKAVAKVLEPIQWQEQLLKTATGDVGVIDWERMNRNARRNKDD